MKRVIKSSIQTGIKKLYGRLYAMDSDAREAFLEGLLFGLNTSDLSVDDVNNIYDIYHAYEDTMKVIKQHVYKQQELI